MKSTNYHPKTNKPTHTTAPLLFLLIPIVVGILLADVLSAIPMFILWVSVILLLCWMALLVFLRRRGVMIPLLLFLLLAFVLRTQLQTQRWSGELPLGLHQVQVQLMDTPRSNAYGYKCTVKVQRIASKDGWESVHSKIVFRLPDSMATNLCRGDYLELRCIIANPRPMKEGETFDYPAFLRKKNIRYVAYLPKDISFTNFVITPSSSHRILMLQRRWCDHLETLALESQSVALAQALLLGCRDHLPADTQTRFRIAGVAHVLSLSGLHVGLFAGLLIFITRPLSRRKLSRWAVLFFQLVALFFYLQITGDAPSTRRATLMFGLMLIGRQMYAPPPITNTLAASALMLLLFDPSLIWDVGFQLSYVAMFSITLIYFPLWGYLQYRFQLLSTSKGDSLLLRFDVFMIKTAIFTTVIQMATLPLTLYHFHSFSTYFLLSNLTLTPLLPLIMALALGALLFGSVPLIGFVMVWLFDAMAQVVDWIIGAVTSLPLALIEPVYFPLWMACGAGGVLVVWAVVLNGSGGGYGRWGEEFSVEGYN